MTTERKQVITLVVAVVFAVAASTALAQGRMGPGKGMPRYDPSTEISLQGTVEEVREVTCTMCPRPMTGTHLVVKAGSERLEVHLGPSRFLAGQEFSFEEGDAIEVTGSKVKWGEGQALLAREVKKGDKVLTLRNTQGVPQWSRGRRRN